MTGEGLGYLHGQSELTTVSPDFLGLIVNGMEYLHKARLPNAILAHTLGILALTGEEDTTRI